MELDALLQTLWPGLLFAVGIFVIVFVVRKIAEGVRPSLAKNTLWEETILPTMPVFLGALGALGMKTYPYPFEHPTWQERVLLGIVAGFASAWAVRIIKAVIKMKTGVDVDAPPTAPAPDVRKP